MENNTRNILADAFKGIVNSYGQVFFSKNRILAAILLVVSFFDVYAGMAGVLAVVFTNSFAIAIGLNKQKVSEGLYGFNSLLVGLGVGIYYQPGAEFYLVLFFISLMTLFITVGFEGVLGKYGLPYLSIPFLFGIWMVMIAAKGYSALDISERGIYNLNEMYTIGGMTMVKLYEWFNNLAIPESLRIYFKSLSAIFFQYHLFAGILIAGGLLFYSRIAFLLSLIGFYTAYYFYHFIGADITEISYSYIGFNYILTAIAVGGFFIVPSRQSIIWVILLTPLVAITLSSTAYIFSIFNLSVFSLPFNIVVILFIYVLKFRERNTDKLAAVTVQLYSPEQHAYSHKNYMQRFGNLPWIAMKLPFWGEWKVTQAHDGEYTHKNDWRQAWDFEIVDDEGKIYDGSDKKLSDYYCFNKPVTTPFDGVIEEIEDGIEDNAIGDMNLQKNWGNSVVIKHDEKFYSQVSHLKNDSIKVVVGQSVKQGDIVAYCGNSGRSLVPHIHFQFQDNPSIGSKTIDYPISSFIENSNGLFSFETSAIPKKDQTISNITTNDLLKNAYHFIPGQVVQFEVEQDNTKRQVNWKIESDIYNNTCFKCDATGAVAWFKELGNVFYFTHYNGKRNTLLYYFFLSSFKVVNAFYPNMQLSDEYPLSIYPDKFKLLVQDLCIPFFRFLKTRYVLNYESFDEAGKLLTLKSSAKFGNGNRQIDFDLSIGEKGITEFGINDSGETIKANRKF